ncbi:MAG: hypothetical protein ACP5H2_10505 [Solirubrobacteraceae bacterium]
MIYVGLRLQQTDLLQPRLVPRHPLPRGAVYLATSGREPESAPACNVAPYGRALWLREQPSGASWPLPPLEVILGAEHRITADADLAVLLSYSEADVAALIESALSDPSAWHQLTDRGIYQRLKRWPTAADRLPDASVYREALKPAIRRLERLRAQRP